MAGALLTVVPKRVYDFGATSVGSIAVITAAERIDVTGYVDCMLAVRVHAATLSGGTIAVDIFGDGFTPEQPALPFRTALPLFTSGVIPAAVALVTYGGTVHGQYIALQISGNRTSASSLVATLSIDLVLRSPDPS